ncbi:MAG: hypothetical protein QOJ56_3449 [Mycobacterium sp.]|jgi:hypothetical protein|nr:hypothetical protein [Mycobacterium sp.]
MGLFDWVDDAANAVGDFWEGVGQGIGEFWNEVGVGISNVVDDVGQFVFGDSPASPPVRATGGNGPPSPGGAPIGISDGQAAVDGMPGQLNPTGDSVLAQIDPAAPPTDGLPTQDPYQRAIQPDDDPSVSRTLERLDRGDLPQPEGYPQSRIDEVQVIGQRTDWPPTDWSEIPSGVFSAPHAGSEVQIDTTTATPRSNPNRRTHPRTGSPTRPELFAGGLQDGVVTTDEVTVYGSRPERDPSVSDAPAVLPDFGYFDYNSYRNSRPPRPESGAAPRTEKAADTTIVGNADEAAFEAAQSTPPPQPDHRYGYYPVKHAEAWISQKLGGVWDAVKAVFPPLTTGLVAAEDLMPYNIPDHFLASGQYAKRWVWYSQRDMAGRGLAELLHGHLEAASAVGGAELFADGLKAGYSMLEKIDWSALHADQRGSVAIPFSGGGNSYKRVLGLERSSVEVMAQNAGNVSLGRELAFDVIMPDDTLVRINIDELFMKPDGTLLNVESKFGAYARFTPNQKTVGVPDLFTVWAVPAPATAARTGLPMQPVAIDTQVFKWLWELGL